VNRTPKRSLIVLAGASALATVGIVWLAVKTSCELPEWALAAGASPLAMRCLTIMAVGMVALGLALAILIRVRPRTRPAGFRGFNGDQGGTAAIEMAFVFPLGLMIFLLVIQAALVFNANMVVHYAAYAAARVAVVVVPLNLVLGNDPVFPEKRNWVRNPDVSSVEKSDKLEMIRRAAVMAVMPISAKAASGTAPDTTDISARVASEPTAAFKHLGVNDQRPWFYVGTKPSYQGLFSRAKAQYDYANGEITTTADGTIKVTQIELAKPWHWSHGRDLHCPYVNSKSGVGDTWWDPIYYCPTVLDNDVPDARMDYDYDHWGWHDGMWHDEQLHVRLTYQFLMEIPYANRFMGDEVQVPGRTGKQYATQIQVDMTLSNEGELELKPLDYEWPFGT